MSERNLFDALYDYCSVLYSTIIARKYFYIFCQGLSPLCLVCHLDTLRGTTPIELIRCNNRLFNKYGILGADDRAGTFSVKKVIEICQSKNIRIPSILFTTGEEIGATGALQFIADCHLSPEISLFLELDRRGCGQYVTYCQLPSQARQYVESWGFQQHAGTFSDIALLCEEFKISGVNLSVGFYNEHTSAETLHIDEMFLTIHRVIGMLKNPIKQLYPLN